MREHKPKFLEEEWKLLLDVLGHSKSPTVEKIGALFGKVWDDITRRTLYEKWSVDRTSLRLKLEELDTLQWMSVLDHCERFWEGDEEDPPLPWEEGGVTR
jgi:hypothetical protein